MRVLFLIWLREWGGGGGVGRKGIKKVKKVRFSKDYYGRKVKKKEGLLLWGGERMKV